MPLQGQRRRVAQRLRHANPVLLREDELAVRVHGHGLRDEFHPLAAHRHEVDAEDAHDDGEARVDVDDGLDVRPGAIDSGMDLDLEALRDAGRPADLESVQVADDHAVRFRAGERVDGVAAPFDDERLRAVRHSHADVPERTQHPGRQPNLRQHPVRNRHLPLDVIQCHRRHKSSPLEFRRLSESYVDGAPPVKQKETTESQLLPVAGVGTGAGLRSSGPRTASV